MNGAGVTWNNIDFDKGTVTFEKQYLRVVERKVVNGKVVRKGKVVWKPNLKNNGSYRTIGIDEDLVELLKEHKERQKELAKKNGKEFKETDWVFTTKTYKGYLEDYSADVMKRAMEDLQITDYKELTPHNLRHTYCSVRHYERN